ASNRPHAGCGDCALPLPSLLFRGATPGRSVDLTGGRFMPLRAIARNLQRPSLPHSAGPARPVGARHPPMIECAATAANRYDRYDRAEPSVLQGIIISHMNDLSKDAVNWLAVGDDGEGQRVDNYLVKILKGVPKSHIYRILRSGEV